MAGSAYTIDGDPATAVDIAVDSSNNLFFADPANDRILKFDPGTGTMSVAAGETGVAGYGGDGVPATSTELRTPMVALP